MDQRKMEDKMQNMCHTPYKTHNFLNKRSDTNHMTKGIQSDY